MPLDRASVPAAKRAAGERAEAREARCDRGQATSSSSRSTKIYPTPKGPLTVVDGFDLEHRNAASSSR